MCTDTSNHVPHFNQYSEKFIYHFDYPELKESGHITIQPKLITIFFPEINHTQSFSNYYGHNVTLYINKHLKFTYQWLPIYTLQDFYKIKEILYKCYNEFKRLYCKQEYCHDNYNAMNSYNNELVTQMNTLYYSIYCFENNYTTSIDITINNEFPPLLPQPNYLNVNIEIFIGNNKIFCSKSDLQNLCYEDALRILIFILFKIAK